MAELTTNFNKAKTQQEDQPKSDGSTFFFAMNLCITNTLILFEGVTSKAQEEETPSSISSVSQTPGD